LAAWPLPRKAVWVGRVNAAQTEAELLAVRRSIVRGSPLGDATWSEQRCVGSAWSRLCVRPAHQKEGKRFLTPFPT
jgi:hypothetical protein